MIVAALLLGQDTVAYVTKPSGPPATEAYMWAGFAITLVALVGYVALMARRISKSKHS